MKSEDSIDVFLGIRSAIATLDMYEQKELTEEVGSYSHRFIREDTVQIEDTIKFLEGNLKIITTISEEHPYTEEEVSIYLNAELVLEGKLYFEQTDLRSEARELKEFESVFSKGISWEKELVQRYRSLSEEINNFIELRASIQEKNRQNRIERKRSGKR